jgi:hypothetical protein
MPDAIQVELLYSGSEVEDGTVPVEDMVDALVGFSGAYDKIASQEQPPEVNHRLRVVGLQKGSAKILVDIVEWVVKNPAPAAVLVSAAGVAVTAASVGGAAAYKVLTEIAGVLSGKTALHGQPITNNYTFNDNRIILPGGVEQTPRQFEYLRSGELDPYLDRMTRPLEEGRGVNEFRLKIGDEELVKVSATERPYLVQREPPDRFPRIRRESPKIGDIELTPMPALATT